MARRSCSAWYLLALLASTLVSLPPLAAQDAAQPTDPFADDEASASDAARQTGDLPAPSAKPKKITLADFPSRTYVVVSSDGRTGLLQGDPLICYYAHKLGPCRRLVPTRAILPILIKDGWKIVRETSMGTKYAGVLILLERPTAPASQPDTVEAELSQAHMLAPSLAALSR